MINLIDAEHVFILVETSYTILHSYTYQKQTNNEYSFISSDLNEIFNQEFEKELNRILNINNITKEQLKFYINIKLKKIDIPVQIITGPIRDEHYMISDYEKILKFL